MESNLKFRFYKAEELIIDSIDSRLRASEKKLRRYIMENIIDRKEPYNLLKDIEELASKNSLEKNEIEKVYENLLKKDVLVEDDNKNINFIYPVSALRTNHRVSLEDGRSFTAMCAIDSIGSHFTFKQNIEINSNCSNTGREVYLKLENGEIVDYYPDDLHILHVDLKNNNDWSADCWNIMNFFCTKNDYDEWVGKMNLDNEGIFCLNASEALAVAKMLFSVSDI